MANSLVGASTKALNPCLLCFPRWCIIGKINAAVLPDPVGAHAIISLLCKAKNKSYEPFTVNTYAIFIFYAMSCPITMDLKEES